MIKEKIQISLPINPSDIEQLNSGDEVFLSGVMFTARDAAHLRMWEALNHGRKLPFDITNQGIYYMGPSPARPGHVIGSAGPTTAGRMDKYTPSLLEHGLKAMIGKGRRNDEVIDSIKKNKGIYFAVVGGAGALLSKSIIKSEIIAYEDLGTEAIRKLEVVNMPAIVAIDSRGNSIYK